MEYKHANIVCVDHPTRLVPRDPKHQARAVSACRLPPAATGDLASQCFVVVEGEMAQWKEGMWCIGWVGLFTAWRCYICGKYSELWCFFFLQKNLGYVCDNHITSQPVLFILCIPKRYKRKKNSVKRRCFILYSLPLNIHGLKISILLVTMRPVSVKSYPASLNNKKTFSHTS